MKIQYSIPVLFAFTLAAVEIGSHYRQIANVVEPKISEHLLKARLRIDAPAFELKQVISAMAKKHNVKEAFIKSIIRAESGFNPNVVSNKGAIGLMQLMPATAQDLGLDPKVPAQNVEAGTKYLGWLLKRYKNQRNPMVKAIAAYNAGPGWVDKYKGVPPFSETRAYVKRVLTYYEQYGGERVVIAQASTNGKRGTRSHRPARHRHADTELAD
jgi:soluble lytic murein transglycosylase-like protein